MATLAKVVEKYRKSGDSALGALGSGIKEKTKEFIDPRRMLFKEGSLLTSMFPGLKPYKAKGPESDSDTSSMASANLSSMEPLLVSIDISTKLSAKNSTILKSMARDMFLVKENMIRLVKLQGGTAREKAGDWAQRQEAREMSFEEQFRKSGKSESKVVKIGGENGEGRSLLGSLMEAVKTIGSMIVSAITTLGSVLTQAINTISAALLGRSVLDSAGGIDIPDGKGKGKGGKVGKAARFAKGAALTAAIGYAAGSAIDYAAGTAGVGKDEEGKDIKIDEEQDETNWKRMSTWQKIQSGAARGIETAGKFAGLGNMSNQARAERIGKETEYLNKTAPSQTGNEQEAMEFFKSKGWTTEQAAGIVGNLKAESNFKTDAVGDGGKAYGIAQWHPDRQATFERVYGKPIQQANFKEQLEYVNWELNNTEKKAGDKLRNAKSAPEAASLVDQFYERSTGAHRQKRMEFAAALMGPSTGETMRKASQEVQVAQRQESGGGSTYNMNTQNTNVTQGKGQQAPAAVASTYDDVFASLHSAIA